MQASSVLWKSREADLYELGFRALQEINVAIPQPRLFGVSDNCPCWRRGADGLMRAPPAHAWKASRFVDADEIAPMFFVLFPNVEQPTTVQLVQKQAHHLDGELGTVVAVDERPNALRAGLEHAVAHRQRDEVGVFGADRDVQVSDLVRTPQCFAVHNALRHPCLPYAVFRSSSCSCFFGIRYQECVSLAWSRAVLFSISMPARRSSKMRALY